MDQVYDDGTVLTRERKKPCPRMLLTDHLLLTRAIFGVPYEK